MSNDTKIFTVDKFLGLNESADGTTELKLGEASVCENFYITDGFNLQSRTGAAVYCRAGNGYQIAGFWRGLLGNQQCFVLVYGSSVSGWIDVRTYDDTGYTLLIRTVLALDIDMPVRMFTMNDRLCISCSSGGSPVLHCVYDDGTGLALHQNEAGYIPVTLTGCNPAGGGTELEPMNILSNAIRLQYSADGESTAFLLPSTVLFVVSVTVDGEPYTGGSYTGANHTYTFSVPPAKGVNNVEFTCRISSADMIAAQEKFAKMKYCEAFNGATDTRLFFYGDGTNVCYYTGIPTYGSGFYLPAGNEIAADTSASPITGMVRNYSKLMVYKPDGALSITYEPVTLADGRVIAGFYLRTVSREFGNEMDGQIQTVNNYPRTLCGGSLYEWRNTSVHYQDERYAKRISEKVSKTLAAADPSKVVTCDDNFTQTYYVFLNDDAGTVLVNRYALDVWSVYTGDVFKNVRFASADGGSFLFANTDSVFSFDPESSYDAPVTEGEAEVPVQSVWESGFMAFGADYRRKYSSRLWVSLLPQSSSYLDVTVQTDKRSEYLTKTVTSSLMDFSRVDFSGFSFLTYAAPRIKRVQLKVKKFVYYKLILRVTKPGARATVLGYDQQIRYSSNVK